MNLLGRARKMWQGLGPATPPKPQYYDVACAEGHRLHGQRTESYQALRCPTCGRGIFILPANPLPDPPPPRSKAAGPELARPVDEGPIPLGEVPVAEGEEPAEAVEWLDPEPTEDEGGSADPPAVDDGFEAIIPEVVQSARDTEPATARGRGPRPAVDRPEAEARGVAIAVPARKRGLRKHALIFVGVAATVAGTIAYRARSLRLQNLPQKAQADLEAGRAALEAGDFTNAKFRLGEAAGALERLGADNAASTRQAASEAAILADLINPTIEDLLQEAARSRSPGDWASRFDRQYRGQSILIEDELAAPEPGSSAAFSLPYRVLAGGKPTVGRIDLAGVALFDAKSFKVGTRVTFGARLASVEIEPDGRWRIALEPESAVLITDFKPLSILGWGQGDSGPPGAPNP